MGKPSMIMSSLPAPVDKAIKEMGLNIRTARLRRRQTMDDLAQRTMLSVPTLRRIERGDHGVSVANYFVALWAMGLIASVRDLASAAEDTSGNLLDLERLPQRVRHAR